MPKILTSTVYWVLQELKTNINTGLWTSAIPTQKRSWKTMCGINNNRLTRRNCLSCKKRGRQVERLNEPDNAKISAGSSISICRVWLKTKSLQKANKNITNHQRLQPASIFRSKPGKSLLLATNKDIKKSNEHLQNKQLSWCIQKCSLKENSTERMFPYIIKGQEKYLTKPRWNNVIKRRWSEFYNREFFLWNRNFFLFQHRARWCKVHLEN